jgi:hypothetical protein
MAIIWRPQKGPQKSLIDCPVYEIFYGGARGGGKTDGVLGKMALKADRLGPKFNCVFFRHEIPMLDDAIARSSQIYGPLGWIWQDQKKTWTTPTGGRLRFRPLERTRDAEKYQGQNLSDVCIEEAGNYPDPAPIMRLHAVIRGSGEGQMHLTGNPGGPGQLWIKDRYIDPCPAGNKVLKEELPNGDVKNRVFIPAKVMDNKILLANDPGYISSLYLVGSEQLVKAWLDGDWSAIEGAYFDCWSSKLIIRPFTIPEHWTKIVSFDWGSARPFSVGWWAVASEDYVGPDGRIPKNAMVRYREWYGANAPNVGLKMTAEQVAQGIASRTAEKIHKHVADPAIFTEDGGPSIAERMRREKVNFYPADNKRIPGWDQMRARMQGEEDRPMVYFFNTCSDSIRTIPSLQHDEIKPEDLDTDGEDHAADEVRYGLMARPYTRPAPAEKKPINSIHNMTLNSLWEQEKPKKRTRI